MKPKYSSFILFQIFSLLLFLSKINCQFEDFKTIFNEQQKNKTLIFELAETTFSYIINNITEEKEIYQECYNAMFNSSPTESSTKSFDLFTSNSGFQIGEIGQEDECKSEEKEEKGNYTLIKYNIEYIHKKDEELFDGEHLYKFLNINESFTGFCIPSKCVEATKKLLLDNNFKDFIKKSLFINLQNSTTFEDKDSHEVSAAYYIFISITGIIIVFMIISLIITIIIKWCLEVEATNLSKKGTKRKEDRIKRSTKNDNSIFNKKARKIYYAEHKTLEKFVDVLSVFDLSYNFRYLITLKNKYFNETNLEILGLLRLISMYSLIFFQNFYVTLLFPQKGQFSKSFYNSWLFNFLINSSHNFSFWIILDGIYMSYKLMAYLKKEAILKPGNAFSFKNFVKFFLRCLPKILICFYGYLFFYQGHEGFHDILDFDSSYERFSHDFIKNRKCYKQWYLIFILPIYELINYKDYNVCYKFLDYFSNEIYAFIIVLLVIFLGFKVKKNAKKYYEIIIYIILLIKILIMPALRELIYRKKNEGETVQLLTIMGNYSVYRNLFYFINFYSIGIFIGIGYFYYSDALTNDSLSSLVEGEIPFKFCDLVFHWFGTLDTWIKVLIFILSLVCITLLNSMYYFFFKSRDMFYYEVDQLFRALNIYDVHLFSIFCGIICICLFTLSDVRGIKNIIKSTIFLIFERCSSFFLMITDLFIYIFYCAFKFQLKIGYFNIFFAGLGLTSIILIFSIILTLCIELFIKKLTKTFRIKVYGRKDDSEELDDNKSEDGENIYQEHPADSKRKQNILKFD